MSKRKRKTDAPPPLRLEWRSPAELAMGALHPADQVFQTGPDLGDLHFAPFAGVFFIGGQMAVDDAGDVELIEQGLDQR